MENIIKVQKAVGLTPLQVIDQLRAEKPELKDEKLAYAGRLDPMAEGIMLILVGDECKKRKSYERLSKEYEFEMLFGISTDTYDILGKIVSYQKVAENIVDSARNILPSFVGRQTQPYPPYSSARVNGRPLFYWAREGKLNEKKIPTKEIIIHDLKVVSTGEISSDELEKYIFERIQKVTGEFRQEEILQLWKEFFEENKDIQFKTMKGLISCSSGTYVRSLVNDIGKKLSTPALTLSIKRTKIG